MCTSLHRSVLVLRKGVVAANVLDAYGAAADALAVHVRTAAATNLPILLADKGSSTTAGDILATLAPGSTFLENLSTMSQACNPQRGASARMHSWGLV